MWGGAGKVAGALGRLTACPHPADPRTQGRHTQARITPFTDHCPCIRHGAKCTLSPGRGQKAASFPQTPAGCLAAGGPAETAPGSPHRLRGHHASPAPWGPWGGPWLLRRRMSCPARVPRVRPRVLQAAPAGLYGAAPAPKPREQRWDVTRAPPQGRAAQGPPHLRPCPQTSEPGPCRWAPLHLNCPPGPQTATSQGPRAGAGGRVSGQGPREARATRTEGVHSRMGARRPVRRTGGVRGGRSGSLRGRAGLSRRRSRGGRGPRGICGGHGPRGGPALAVPPSAQPWGHPPPVRLTSAVGGAARRGASRGAGPARPGALHGYLSRLPRVLSADSRGLGLAQT